MIINNDDILYNDILYNNIYNENMMMMTIVPVYS